MCEYKSMDSKILICLKPLLVSIFQSVSGALCYSTVLGNKGWFLVISQFTVCSHMII